MGFVVPLKRNGGRGTTPPPGAPAASVQGGRGSRGGGCGKQDFCGLQPDGSSRARGPPPPGSLRSPPALVRAGLGLRIGPLNGFYSRGPSRDLWAPGGAAARGSELRIDGGALLPRAPRLRPMAGWAVQGVGAAGLGSGAAARPRRGTTLGRLGPCVLGLLGVGGSEQGLGPADGNGVDVGREAGAPAGGGPPLTARGLVSSRAAVRTRQ